MSDASNRLPGRPRSDASREAILDAAYWQVLERGYGAVTAQAIAKAAGAGKQTLYRWWPSKGAVVLEAFAAKMRERIDRPQEAAIRAGDVALYLRSLFANSAAGHPALRLLLAEAQSDAKLLAAFRARIVEPRLEALRLVLERRVPDPAVRGAVVEAIDGAIWRRLLLGDALDEAFARQLAALAPA